jgi:uncharacterized GH25 family protein
LRKLAAFIVALALATPLMAMKGVVFTSSGDPVAGAKVEVFAPERAESALERLLAGNPAAPIAAATTNAAGSFSIDLKSDGAVFVAAKADGYTPTRMMVSAGADDVVLEVQRAATKSGTVRSAKGPVAGARILVADQLGDVIAAFQANDHGQYSMPDPKHWVAMLCVRHPDYEATCHTPTQIQPITLDFKLESGSVLSGHVVSDMGKPVANARVTAGRISTTTTKDDGSFTIHGNAHAKTLRATSGDLAGTAPAVQGDITIKLAQGHRIFGTVRDDAGHALPGSRVIVQMGDETDDWFTAIVNAKGEYSLAPLTASRYGVYVQAPPDFEGDGAEADLRKKSEARVDIAAKKSVAIRGAVRDEQKRPVAGAIVAQLVQGMPLIYSRGGAFYSRVVTGPDGTFKLRSAQPQGRIVAIKPGFAAGLSDELKPETMQKLVTITLPLGVAVTGNVVTADNKPVSGAKIIAMTAWARLGALPIASSLATGAIEEWVTSDDEGHFTIQLNRGAHDFGVWKQGFAARDVGGVEAGDNGAPLRIELEPAVEIRGRVVRKGSKPADGGVISAIDPQQRGTSQAAVAEDGSFTIGSLQPGPYLLRYGNDERTFATKTATAPANNVVIELPETAELHGRVTDKATGSPIGQFQVNAAAGENGHENNQVSDADGRFTQAVAAGSVELTITAPGYSSATRTISVVEGKPLEPVNFALVKGRKISGRVTSTEGRAVAEAGVGSDQANDGAMTDEEGDYEIDGVTTEQIVLDFQKQGFVAAHKPVPAGPGDQRIDVTMSSGRRITGRVVDKSGAPVEEAQVTASSEAHDADYQNATTDKSGAFTISGLASAHYSFQAVKTGAGQAKQDDVDVTKTTSLVLTLGKDATGTIHGSIAGVTSGGWMNAMVYAQGENGNANGQVGRDGKFVVENVPIGEVSVRGMLMSMQRRSSTKAVKTVVTAGSDVEVQLTTTPGDATVRGVVRSGGEPMSGASVDFWSEDGNFSETTGADGSYAISGLEPGHYNVGVSRALGGGANYATELDVAGSTTFDINILFVRIEGRVVDDRGAPVEGAKITATSPAKQHSNDVTASSDAAGAFAISVQGDSGYLVSAVRKGFAVASAQVDAGSAGPVLLTLQRSEGARVRIVDTRSGATLTGYVVVHDESGKTQIPLSGEKDADGTLLLPLPAGTYRVSASASEYSSTTVRLTVPSDVTSVPLTPGGTLVVKSSDDARELIKLVLPNGDEYVRCYCNGVAEIRLTGATTKIDHVAPGAYRMDVIDAHNVRNRSYPVTITEAQLTTVDATK